MPYCALYINHLFLTLSSCCYFSACLSHVLHNCSNVLRSTRLWYMHKLMLLNLYCSVHVIFERRYLIFTLNSVSHQISFSLVCGLPCLRPAPLSGSFLVKYFTICINCGRRRHERLGGRWYDKVNECVRKCGRELYEARAVVFDSGVEAMCNELYEARAVMHDSMEWRKSGSELYKARTLVHNRTERRKCTRLNT